MALKEGQTVSTAATRSSCTRPRANLIKKRRHCAQETGTATTRKVDRASPELIRFRTRTGFELRTTPDCELDRFGAVGMITRNPSKANN